MGLLDSLLGFYIRWLWSIPLLILLVRVGLDILPIWIGFCTSEVNGRGLSPLQDVNVCPKLVHTSTSCVPFTLWRRSRLRRGSGMFSLIRSFWDWRGRTFRAVRGMLWRATPLHSASDRGSDRLDGVWGPQELEVICVHFVRNWCYSTKAVHGVLFAEADNMCPQHLPHRSHFQRVLVNLVPPHFRSGIVGSTIPYIGTIVKLDNSENPFLILKHSYIQLQVQRMKFNGQ